MVDTDPPLHPDDRPATEDRDETGPWLALVAASGLAWVVLVLVDRRVLAEGTFLWATARSLYTLVLAPLAAAALLQDTRALGVEGVEIGPLKWLYAAVALLFLPREWRLPVSPARARRSSLGVVPVGEGRRGRDGSRPEIRRAGARTEAVRLNESRPDWPV